MLPGRSVYTSSFRPGTCFMLLIWGVLCCWILMSWSATVNWERCVNMKTNGGTTEQEGAAADMVKHWTCDHWPSSPIYNQFVKQLSVEQVWTMTQLPCLASLWSPLLSCEGRRNSQRASLISYLGQVENSGSYYHEVVWCGGWGLGTLDLSLNCKLFKSFIIVHQYISLPHGSHIKITEPRAQLIRGRVMSN